MLFITLTLIEGTPTDANVRIGCIDDRIRSFIAIERALSDKKVRISNNFWFQEDISKSYFHTNESDYKPTTFSTVLLSKSILGFQDAWVKKVKVVWMRYIQSQFW